MKKSTLLCILDGWGYREEKKHNSIANAKTPNWDRFLQKYPFSLLKTSGLDVGLPEGQMGNSEVGHMNIGSGRVNLQMLPRINQAISDNSLADYEALKVFCHKLQESKGACHLFGILSDGGVHGHIAHLVYLAQVIAKHNVPVKIHAMLDGRDTAPQSAKQYLEQLIDEIKQLPLVELASICGRYYAMDRDNNWDRIEKVSLAVSDGVADKTEDFLASLNASYVSGINDEFVLPHVDFNYQGMSDGDGFFMTNFRADRVRQIIPAILDPKFNHFSKRKVNFAASLGMSEYSDEIDKYLPCLFPTSNPENTLSELLEAHDLTQLHIAETEKYAHVTFFFNGGIEQPRKGEKRILIPSPDVATYDLQPEMSALKVTDELLKAIASGEYDFIVVNFANPDMVGHTGSYEAAMQAAEVIDNCLSKLEQEILAHDGKMLITADHGNLEEMYNDVEKQPNTSHTLNPVPFVFIDNEQEFQLKNGRLADIAPTILELMSLTKPQEMTGSSLLVRNKR